MIKFRFYSWGIAPQSRKHYLSPAARGLKNLFTASDIKPGMFSLSIEKRLRRAKKHGTMITLRSWRNVRVGVRVVNHDDRKQDALRKKEKLKTIKSKMKNLVKMPEIGNYLKLLKQYSEVVGDPHFYPLKEFQIK